MFDGLRNRIDDILRAVRGDEDAFNRVADAERLGVYMRHAAFTHPRSDKPIPVAWQLVCCRRCPPFSDRN